MASEESSPALRKQADVNSAEEPPAKRRAVACPINKLSDEDLAKIFQQLPLYERLLVSEVCKRWHGISRTPWRDVVSIDLTPIPGERVGAIVKQCPDLRTVLAKNASLKHLQSLSRLSLASLHLYDCSGVFSFVFDFDLLSWVLPKLPNADVEELVVHNLNVIGAYDFQMTIYTVPDALPASLKRLQLSGLIFRTSDPGYEKLSEHPYFRQLERLQTLTCLILCCSAGDLGIWCTLRRSKTLPALQKLTNLRELYIGSYFEEVADFGDDFAPLADGLPKLEVLFLDNVMHHSGPQELSDLATMITKHPSLRILCITGRIKHDVEVPPRPLYPNGFDADPLPLLHVFLGKQAAERFLFACSPAAEIHPITAPLPAFVEKEEIAPIFKGVWIAKQLKESVKHGAKLSKFD